jgi:RIO kinase 1
MKNPKELQSLIEDGVIDEVIRSLKSGKEAAVYIVRAKAELLCAKVYKNMSQRSFQKRAQYQEGRQVRGSRQTRAIGKRSRFGRREEEAEWKNTEVDALYRLAAAGVRVPKPYGYFDGVLLMELVVDAEGHSAPSLGDVEFTPEEARTCHRMLIQQVQRMLCAGLIHGDLSQYNVLAGRDGPVIIDLPQAVNAAGNNSALKSCLFQFVVMPVCLVIRIKIIHLRIAPTLPHPSFFSSYVKMWCRLDLIIFKIGSW